MKRKIQCKIESEKEKRQIQTEAKVVKVKREIEEVSGKRNEVEREVKGLRERLFQIDESISMTKEDLTSKLLQRANFVAQREELDEIYEASKKQFGEDFELYWKLQEKPTQELYERYTNLKHRNFYLDILQQLHKFALSKEICNESEMNNDSKYRNKINFTNEIQLLIDGVKKNLSESSFIEDQIWSISKKLDLSLKHDVLFQKKQEVSEKTDKAYSEKYGFKIYKEIQKCENNIKQNYSTIDQIVIPQLKSLSSEYKTNQKNYKKLKKTLPSLNEKVLALEISLLTIIQSMKTKNQSNYPSNNSITEISMTEESNSDGQIYSTKQKQAHILKEYNEWLKEITQVDKKLDLLIEYKERNEQQLRERVDELKYELRAVREELKNLEKEKYTIANKLNSIEAKYNEAKESFKNAEEVLASTNRMIINCSLRQSNASDTLNWYEPTVSIPQQEVWRRFETDESSKYHNNAKNRLKVDFYNTEPQIEKIIEEDADLWASEVSTK